MIEEYLQLKFESKSVLVSECGKASSQIHDFLQASYVIVHLEKIASRNLEFKSDSIIPLMALKNTYFPICKAHNSSDRDVF
jgi:hypothetical protein